MKNFPLILVMLISAAIILAGCSLRSGSLTADQTNPPTQTVVRGTPASETVPTTFGPDFPSAPMIGEYTTIATTRPAPDNPYLEELSITRRTFLNPLPSCFMEHAFPSIATDPGYGIQQVLPRLTSVSEHEYKDFLRDYTEGESENTALKTPAACQNTANEPTWNFIRIRIILVPTNYEPSDYTITENVLADGQVIAQFSFNERLTIDKKLIITRYVPIHADEVDLFNSVRVTFTRH